MKCLLALPRFSEQESLFPPSGRPHLDLLLHTLGIHEVTVAEVDPQEGIDIEALAEGYGMVLVQCQAGGRLRRSVLSHLGLSLGLQGAESKQLRVSGAKQITDADGNWAGFAVQRRGRLVVYLEKSVWELRSALVQALKTLLAREEPVTSRRAVARFPACWLLEAGGGGLDLEKIPGMEGVRATVQSLPDGDAALLLPPSMGPEVKEHLAARMGSDLYATAPRPLERILADRLKAAGLTVATAESCTSGLTAARLTSPPGSSAYFLGGVATYSDAAKHQLLDVPEVTLKNCGAVSPEAALAMARGAQRAVGSNLAVAITGIAGPDGGTPDKPVGTVFLAAVDNQGGALKRKMLYRGFRERIRFQASQTALHLLRRLLDEREGSRAS